MRMFLVYFVLCLSALTSANSRIKRQISFSSQQATPSEVTVNDREAKPLKTSSDKISFGGTETKSNPKTKPTPNEFSLKDILKLEEPAPALSARFGFSSVTAKIDQSCVTPLGEPGTCRFIVDNQCRPVLNRIIKYGVTQSILKYLLAAIKHPCGFEQNDLSLCCAERITTTSTTTTTTTTASTSPPQTTTTTTTTTSTTPFPVGQCGISKVVSSRVVHETMRIVGGEVARPNSWPWTALLGRSGLSGGMTVVCGGSLISHDTILTAAHCFDGGSRDPTMVRLGEHDITTTDDTPRPVVDINIKQVIKHPNWNTVNLDNDIAIVKLSTNIAFSDTMVPICLPEDYVETDIPSLLNKLDPVVVGWGATQTYGLAETVLRQATVPMVSQDQCSNAYSGVNVNIGDTKICAGNGGTDTCNGDSGGPLLADKLGDRWSIIGITSFGVECGRPDFPGVYTRVDKYLDFIKQNL